MDSGDHPLVRNLRTWLTEAQVADGFLLAVSGGLDSTVLAHLLAASGTRTVIAHVHHGLRGAAADGDAAFVMRLAESLGVEGEILRVELAKGDDLQARARAARYEALAEMAVRRGLTGVATAHHREDQAETVLLHLLRGSGPDGLAGMRPVRSMGQGLNLYRPLLDTSQSELHAYAELHRLEWREDKSNKDLAFRRNRIRLEVLPMLADLAGGDVAARIARSAEQIGAYRKAALDPVTDALLAGAVRPLPDAGLLVEEAVLTPLPEIWRNRVLLAVLRKWFPDVTVDHRVAARLDRLLAAQVGRREQLGSIWAWRERGGIALVPPQSPPEAVDWELDSDRIFGTKRWSAHRLPVVPSPPYPDASREVVVDADRLHPPLRLRPWRAGDAIQPVGMKGSKKVQDVLTEARVDAHRRASVPVVESDGVLVWVVGHRLDRRFAIGPETRVAARLQLLDPI